VHDTENSRVGADAEGDNRDGGGEESGVAAHGAEGESEVLFEFVPGTEEGHSNESYTNERGIGSQESELFLNCEEDEHQNDSREEDARFLTRSKTQTDRRG